MYCKVDLHEFVLPTVEDWLTSRLHDVLPEGSHAAGLLRKPRWDEVYCKVDLREYVLSTVEDWLTSRRHDVLPEGSHAAALLRKPR